MAKNSKPSDAHGGGAVMRGIERVGNMLPDPFILFMYLFLAVCALSTVVAAFGVGVVVPGNPERIEVKGAFSSEGVGHLLGTAVDAYVGFPALGPVLIIALGIGIAHGTGALEALMRVAFHHVSPRWVPYVVAFVACQGHLLADSSYILLPPLAALAFKAVGRHPLAGLLGAYACVGTSYNGGLAIGTLDVTTAGITQSAAALIPGIDSPDVHVAMNYFFTAANGLILPLVGGFLIDRVLEPRLKPWNPAHDPAHDSPDADHAASGTTTVAQRRGLVVGALVAAAFTAAVVAAWLVPGSPLRGEGGALVPSPFTDAISVVLAGSFALFGVVYARVANVEKSVRAVYPHMVASVRDLAGFIVLIFAIAQTINVLSWSNLTTWAAVRLARGAEEIGLTGFWIMLAVVIVTMLLNLFVTSGSALWSLEASVVVPAFMLLGLTPAAAQAAFRIGDSVTGAITPMQVFLYFTLIHAQKYQPDLKLGTVLSRLVPFALSFAVVWTGILGLFYLFDLPLGPGAPIHIP